KFALGIDLAPAPHLHNFLGRDHDLFELLAQAALLGLVANGFGDLLLEVRIGMDDIPAFRHSSNFSGLRQCPNPSTNAIATRMIWSVSRKNIEASADTMKTMTVVIATSRRDGQVILSPSARTSCKNLNGLI